MPGIVSVLVMFVMAATAAVFYFSKNRKMRVVNGKLCNQLKLQDKALHKVSSEIHENVCQSLVLAKLILSSIDGDVSGQEAEKFRNSRELIGGAITDLRKLGRHLDAEVLDLVGLDDAIRNELLMVSKSAHFRARLTQKGRKFRFDQQKEVVVFRLFQELIANINKRDDAKTVNVRLLYRPHVFNLMVSDDGTNVDETRCSGIKNMQSRAELIGANFQFSSIPGKGNSVSIDLPFD